MMERLASISHRGQYFEMDLRARISLLDSRRAAYFLDNG
jgi:hypothetical protein